MRATGLLTRAVVGEQVMKKLLFPVMLLFIISVFTVTGFTAVDAVKAEKTVKVEQVKPIKILDNPGWLETYTNYEVDESFLDTLKSKVDESLKVDVYLGFWCSDSKRNVPRFYKIIENLDGTGIKVNYFSCGRKPSKEVKYFAADVKVERVPTFIFYRDGKEIGRIIENPKTSILEDFLEIVF